MTPLLGRKYTTGQIAKIAKVGPRMVSKWIDKGILIGHYIPGRRDRRVYHADLVQFYKDQKLNLAELEYSTDYTILVIDLPLLGEGSEWTQMLRNLKTPGLNILEAQDAFTAGVLTAEKEIQSVILSCQKGTNAAKELIVSFRKIPKHPPPEIRVILGADAAGKEEFEDLKVKTYKGSDTPPLLKLEIEEEIKQWVKKGFS